LLQLEATALAENETFDGNLRGNFVTKIDGFISSESVFLEITGIGGKEFKPNTFIKIVMVW